MSRSSVRWVDVPSNLHLHNHALRIRDSESASTVSQRCSPGLHRRSEKRSVSHGAHSPGTHTWNGDVGRLFALLEELGDEVSDQTRTALCRAKASSSVPISNRYSRTFRRKPRQRFSKQSMHAVPSSSGADENPVGLLRAAHSPGEQLYFKPKLADRVHTTAMANNVATTLDRTT
jgi:hypothetical protein